MYNYTVVRLFLCLTAIIVLTVGCSKAPDEQVAAARSAVDSAMVAEAEKYAPEQFKAAKDSLDVALAEIEKQNSKFALSRKYGKSEQQLQSAESLARSAMVAAAANKAQIRSEAEEMLTQLQTAIEDTKALIEKAPRGKEGTAAIESIKSDVAAVEMTLSGISEAMGKEDFIGARETASAGLQKLQSISDEINQAIAKKQGMRK
jgi:uncharacterized membrane protein YccC